MNSTKPLQSATPWGLYGAIGTLWVWLLIATMLNGAQFKDNLEHFIWSHSFEWGYWKHPPLPTWLVYGLNHAFGPNARWTYVLAGLCFTVTVVATYRIAQHLFDRHAASVVAMILSLHLGFTRGAQLYNHNTVMMAAIALTVWAALWAVQRGRLGWWVLVGILAGLSVLAKYQSAFPLLGIVLAIALSPDRRRHAAGVLLSVVIALCVMTPHFVWLTNAPATPLQYAMGYVSDDQALLGRWMRVGAFVGKQILYYLPLIVFMTLAWFYQPSRPSGATSKPDNPDKAFNPMQKAWMIGLLGFPMCVMVVVALGFGVQIQGAWGLQASQFLPVFIAPWVMQKCSPFSPFHVRTWWGIQIFALTFWVTQNLGWVEQPHQTVESRELPGQAIAQQAQAYWRAHTACPLRYLSGEYTMAGIISIYSGHHLLVLEDNDPAKSPWIDLADMRHSGYLAISVNSRPEPVVDALVIPLVLRKHQNQTNPPHSDLVIQFVSPVDCAQDMPKNNPSPAIAP